MAIYLDGATVCPICSQVIHGAEEAVCYPPFIENERDELRFIHDGSFHKECLDRHPLSERIYARLNIYENALKNLNRCIICASPVTSPDECFALGFFTYAPDNSLYRFNYRICHCGCLKSDSPLGRALNELAT